MTMPTVFLKNPPARPVRDREQSMSFALAIVLDRCKWPHWLPCDKRGGPTADHFPMAGIIYESTLSRHVTIIDVPLSCLLTHKHRPHRVHRATRIPFGACPLL